ncbi:hypothetical protein Tco_0679815 [Tanacetum coccineum]|uniref:Uncharacterized protein n=1 Tax=Tanacetum coccineum TaxID=301880 RepID=A0ABQ4XK66_9ASTR
MAKIQEVSPKESSSTSQPLEQVQNHDENDVFANVDQNAAECVDERAALANLIANLTLDTEENKTILKQLKKANASLTQELENVTCVPTANDIELLIKNLSMPLHKNPQNDSFRFEHELKTEMHEDYEYVKSLEKEVDELESEKANFSNMYDLLLEECVSKDVICSYLPSLSDLKAFMLKLQCFVFFIKSKNVKSCTNAFRNKLNSVNKES